MSSPCSTLKDSCKELTIDYKASSYRASTLATSCFSQRARKCPAGALINSCVPQKDKAMTCLKKSSGGTSTSTHFASVRAFATAVRWPTRHYTNSALSQVAPTLTSQVLDSWRRRLSDLLTTLSRLFRSNSTSALSSATSMWIPKSSALSKSNRCVASSNNSYSSSLSRRHIARILKSLSWKSSTKTSGPCLSFQRSSFARHKPARWP